MRCTKIFFPVVLVIIFLFSSLIYADVPQMINYQGKITKPSGALVDTTVGMIFTIYDAATDGGVLWADTNSAVEVQKGVFSTLLGSVNPIPDSVFDGNVRYLGVKVGADPEMTPRKEIVSVAYAYTDGDWIIGGNNVYREKGNVGIGTDNPLTALYVDNDTDGFVGISIENTNTQSNSSEGIYFWNEDMGVAGIRLFDDDAPSYPARMNIFNNRPGGSIHFGTGGQLSRLTIANDGNVGIGITSPAKKLHVAGSVTIDDTLFTNHVSSRSPLTLQTDGTTRMYIDDTSGDVGIGTTNPASRLNVQGSDAILTVENTSPNTDVGVYLRENGGAHMGKFWYDGSEGLLKIETFPEDRDIYIEPGDGGVGIGGPTPTNKLDVFGTARIRSLPIGTGPTVISLANGVLGVLVSSIRYKENIKDLQADPGRIFQLKPVRFNWKTTGQEDIGLIAEDVDEVIPDLVLYDSEGKPESVKYDKVAIYLLEVVKTQQKRISALEQQITELKR